MKVIIYTLLSFILFSCSNSGTQSAFVGELPKSSTAPVGTIPAESIYQLTDTFQTQDNKPITLSSFRGKPVVIGMIFTHCDYACPRLTADIKNIESKLGDKKEQVNFILVSFDSERDLPEQLKKYASSSGLDKNWTLLHGDETMVRTLSVLLNVQFEKDASGNFSHSNIISVLDKNGNLIFQKEGLGADPQGVITAINDALNGHSA